MRVVAEQIVGDLNLIDGPVEFPGQPQFGVFLADRGAVDLSGTVLRRGPVKPQGPLQEPFLPIFPHVGAAARDAEQNSLLHQALQHGLQVCEAAADFTGQLARSGKLGAGTPFAAFDLVEQEVADLKILVQLHNDVTRG